jgi:hypothetical protein
VIASRREKLFLTGFGLAALVFLPPALAPEWEPVRSWLTEPLRLLLGGPTKLFLLALGAAAATRVARKLNPSHPARGAWRLFAAGLGLFCLGQATLLVYQLLLRVPTPFPSIADPFFLLGSLALVPSLTLQLMAWRRAGLPLDSRRDLVLAGLVTAAVLGAILALALRPVIAAGGPGIEIALNLAYPICDALFLLPTVLLLRLTWRLRGGTAGGVWSSVLLGLIALAAGDIAFAYLTGVGITRLDPVVDLLFIAGYGAIARGALRQLDLLS